MTKAELRKIYLQKMALLEPDERADKSMQIADVFFRKIDLQDAFVFHTFISIAKFGEIDTAFIYQYLWAKFPAITVVAPVSNLNSGEMRSVIFSPNTQLRANQWGISEPTGNEFIAVDKIDIVVVPLVCFDNAGQRVGYGKGFYDRFLRRCRPACKKIGLSYFEPTNIIKDVGEHDVTLDCVVTPDGVQYFDKKMDK